ncbi:MAG: antA/AntB antirepressor family protein [Planctomycetia bacterium]
MYGVDYEVFDSPELGDQPGKGGDRRSKLYALTLDMAKELAMVEPAHSPQSVARSTQGDARATLAPVETSTKPAEIRARLARRLYPKTVRDSTYPSPGVVSL